MCVKNNDDIICYKKEEKPILKIILLQETARLNVDNPTYMEID